MKCEVTQKTLMPPSAFAIAYWSHGMMSPPRPSDGYVVERRGDGNICCWWCCSKCARSPGLGTTPDGSAKSVVGERGNRGEKTRAPTRCHPPALGQGSKCSILEITTGPFAIFRKWPMGRNGHGPLNTITRKILWWKLFWDLNLNKTETFFNNRQRWKASLFDLGRETEDLRSTVQCGMWEHCNRFVQPFTLSPSQRVYFTRHSVVRGEHIMHSLKVFSQSSQFDLI